MASLPELGAADGGRLAALAALAPYAHDSGTLKGIRQIRGGRPDVRRALYLAELSVARTETGTAVTLRRPLSAKR